jgi:hypothetical protein
MSNPIKEAMERVREAVDHHRTHDATPATHEPDAGGHGHDPHAVVAGDLAARGLNVGGMPAEGIADDVADPDVIDAKAVESAVEAAERADLGRIG